MPVIPIYENRKEIIYAARYAWPEIGAGANSGAGQHEPQSLRCLFMLPNASKHPQCLSTCQDYEFT